MALKLENYTTIHSLIAIQHSTGPSTWTEWKYALPGTQMRGDQVAAVVLNTKNGKLYVAPNSFTVRFKPTSLASAHHKHGLVLTGELSFAEGMYVVTSVLSSGELIPSVVDVLALARRLSSSEDFLWAEPNLVEYIGPRS